jgi:hypothetical protein
MKSRGLKVQNGSTNDFDNYVLMPHVIEQGLLRDSNSLRKALGKLQAKKWNSWSSLILAALIRTHLSFILVKQS